ncbi:hypothetical protein V6N12_076331 [Hibiscus sabdariffa]|uniref:RNase H type-1 domain-containing protein n=1 Tax=Hibiscus sabdariffa TaxID=183260 RepID=A0ABR2D9H7_9ROSI
MVRPSCCTPLWHVVSKAWPILRSSIAWSIGNGAVVDFFDDVWVLALGPLRLHVLDRSQELPSLSFSDFMDGNGNWDLNLLSTIFPHSVISHIISIKGPDSNDIVDKPYWKLSNSRSFSIRSTYCDCIFSPGWRTRSGSYVERCCRFIGQSPSCPCCDEFAETTIHVHHDCPLATVVWTNLIPPNCSFDFFHSNLQDWMCSNLTTDHIHLVLDLRWSIVFASTLCLEAIQRLKAMSAATDVHALVHAIDRLQNARWATILRWISHETNKLADAMAKFNTSYDLSLFTAPLSPLQPLLASDCSSLL